MNIRMMRILTLCLPLSLMSVTLVTTSGAATVFSGSSILDIDHGQRTITFKTKEGETWTLPVTDPELFKRKTIAKNDKVTIEIDFDDRIINVVKPGETSTAPRTDTEDR
ncbi:MAG TPA: hypothetical protein VJR03_00425 [Nitrospira sp.]|nr:hypothetical protein [Nitrospira sp.]